MEIEEIKQRFNAALEEFYKYDSRLLARDVNERTLTHRLAVYLEGQFPEFHVDCEYNKNGEEKKFLRYEVSQDIVNHLQELYRGKDILKKLVDGEIVFNSTYPDIIIHKREYSDRNILIIEVKKYEDMKNLNSSRQEDVEIDLRKLRGFTRSIANDGYGYVLGLFLNLSKLGISKCTKIYFREGIQEGAAT